MIGDHICDTLPLYFCGMQLDTEGIVWSEHLEHQLIEVKVGHFFSSFKRESGLWWTFLEDEISGLQNQFPSDLSVKSKSVVSLGIDYLASESGGHEFNPPKRSTCHFSAAGNGFSQGTMTFKGAILISLCVFVLYK